MRKKYDLDGKREIYYYVIPLKIGPKFIIFMIFIISIIWEISNYLKEILSFLKLSFSKILKFRLSKVVLFRDNFESIFKKFKIIILDSKTLILNHSFFEVISRTTRTRDRRAVRKGPDHDPTCFESRSVDIVSNN